jgi:hypothetical protein
MRSRGIGAAHPHSSLRGSPRAPRLLHCFHLPQPATTALAITAAAAPPRHQHAGVSRTAAVLRLPMAVLWLGTMSVRWSALLLAMLTHSLTVGHYCIARAPAVSRLPPPPLVSLSHKMTLLVLRWRARSLSLSLRGTKEPRRPRPSSRPRRHRRRRRRHSPQSPRRAASATALLASLLPPWAGEGSDLGALAAHAHAKNKSLLTWGTWRDQWRPLRAGRPAPSASVCESQSGAGGLKKTWTAAAARYPHAQ